MSTRVAEEVARLALHLDVVIRWHGETHRSIERRLGWSISYLNKLIRGASPLRVEHILAVLEVLGEDPATFFRAVYPADLPLPHTAQEALAAFEGGGHPAAAQPSEFTREVRRALLEMLSAGPEEEDAAPAGAAPQASRAKRR